MRFAFTDEQLLFRDAVRDLLAKECSPAAVRAAWDADGDGAVHQQRWRGLADMGVLGMMVPEVHGGLGLTELDLVLPLEETGRAALPEPIVGTAAVGAPLLAEVAESPIAAEWLPRIVAGDAVVVVQAGGKPSFSFAAQADLMIMVHHDEVHAVPRDQVTLTPQRSVDGSRQPALVDWHRRSDTQVASGPAGWAAVNRAFDRGALATAAQLLGLADRMITMTVEYVGQREQFGVPVGSFQAVKHQLADAFLALEFARPVVYRAACTMAHGGADRSRDVSMAKIYAAEAAQQAGRVALQCHGAIGYTVEYDLHLYLKRAWALAPMWGGVPWHLDRVATTVLDGAAALLPDPEPDLPLGETLA